MKDQIEKGSYVEKRFRAGSGDIDVKEADDGRTLVRMPISSTALDRDGDEFSRAGLEHERDQINEGKVPAFLDHGRGSRGGFYGALGMVGTWANADVVTETVKDDDDEDDEEDVLYADFVPTKANEDAADIVALLQDDMPVGASVGFRIEDYEYVDEDNKYVFNAVDLLETSIVGVPSNPLTVNDGANAIGAKALGSPESPRPRDGAGKEVTVTLDGLTLLQDEIAGLRDDLEARDTDTESESESDDDTDTMSDDPEGGDDPANEPDDTDEDLRSAVEAQTEKVGDLVDSIDSLLDEQRSDGSDEESPDSDTDTSDDEDSDEAADADDDKAAAVPDRETVQLFVGDDADEDVRKEFEALREKADNDEIDLADSETRLFGSEEEETDDEADDNGALI